MRTWKYLILNQDKAKTTPRLWFIKATCKSEAEHYARKRCNAFIIVDKYEDFVAAILGYEEIKIENL